MAEDSDGTLKAVVICEGDLHDPDFPQKFRSLLGKLKSILDPPKKKKRFLKVDKVEPWNSVRVTLSIPKDAATKLRQLAAEGNTALRALGILSVQLEGDTVISLRLVGQEIVLRTENENAQAHNGPDRNRAATNGLADLLACVPTPQNNQQSQQTICAGNNGEGPSGLSTIKQQPQQLQQLQQPIIRANSIDSAINATNGPIDTKSIFKSPNTICPMDGKLPTPVPSNLIESREYPFESMTQARVIQRRENTMGQIQNQDRIRQNIDPTMQSAFPPPPYPGANLNPLNTHLVSNKVAINQQQQQQQQLQQQPAQTSGNIAISSPLLVNLLQNESTPLASNVAKIPPPIPNTNAIANIGQQTVIPNTQATIVKSGSEIVILSNNSMAHQPLQSPQINQASNFVVPNSGSGAEIGFNKCVAIPQQAQVTKQTIQSPGPHHQMRVQQATFVNVSTVQATTNESIQPSQQNIHSCTNSNNNILTPPQQQTNSIVIAGNTPVPSTINSVNVNKIQQSRYPQPQQAIPPTLQTQLTHSQQYQQFTNQPQMRSNMIHACTPLSHSSQPPMGNMIQMSPNQLTSTQGMPTQIVLQKHQMRAMHPNMMNQQQIVGTNMRQVEFRQSTPTNVVMQQNQVQPNQVQQFQQAQQQQPQVQTTSIMQPSVSGNTLQTFNSQLGSQQISQQIVPQMDTYNPRWPLKPMDSATQSSFQEFARYQMQYNLSQQQNSTDAQTSIADHLADLDEITRTDLESLLPSINDTDLDSALELDIKAPLESLLDAKDLELDLIDPSVTTDSIARNTTNSCAPIVSGTGISQMSGIANSLLLGSLQPQTNASQMHFQNQQQPQLNMQQQIVANSNQFNKQQDIIKRAVGPNMMAQHTNVMNIHQPMASRTVMKQPKTHQMGQFKIEQKIRTSTGKEKQVLINPLTGELEPIPSEESGDELIPIEGAATYTNTFATNTSIIMYSDDDNSCSTGFSRASDYSDNDPLNNSEHSKGKTKRKEKKDSTKKPKAPKTPKNSLLKEKLQQGLKEKIIGKTKEKNKSKNISSPIISNASIAEMSDNPEKIKLRLKLGKSEPVSSAYKVDVSFGEGSKRVSAPNLIKQTFPITSSATNSVQSNASHSISGSHLPNATGLTTSEELRVPPLHISLRGRNSVVIKNSKKARKKSQGGGEDEEKKYSNKKGHMRSMNIDNIDTCSQKSANNASVAISEGLHKNQIETAKGFPIVEPILGNDESIQNSNETENVDIQTQGAIEDRESSAMNQTQLDSMKRPHASVVTPNGPVNPEKKRRLSMGTAMPSSSIMTKMSEYSKLSQIMDSSVESIREAIGSTNVGTLPKHSQLMTTKVQKAANNNNNSLTPNKAKVTNKLKPKAATTDNLKLIVSDTVPENVVDEAQIPSELIESNSNWHSSDAKTITPNETKTNANMKNDDLNVNSAVLSNQIQSKTNESTANSINTTINGSIQKPLNITTQNTQIINRLIDIKDSPRRDIIEGLIISSHTIRCSPASQTQGEDSGIESMDALSEKSPHQTASPVANDMKNVEAIKEVVAPKPAINDIDNIKEHATCDKYSNIEAALAKMEGLNDFVTSHCDKNGVAVDIEKDSQKMNGKHYNLESGEPVHRLVNDLVESNKVDNSDIVITGKTNECPNVEDDNGDTVQSDLNIECKDMNENKTTTELNEIKADEKTCINITDNKSITLSSEVKDEMKTFDENRNDDKKIISIEPTTIESNQIDSQIFDQIESFESSIADVSILDKAEIMDTSETDRKIDMTEGGKEANVSDPAKSAEDKEIEDTMNAARIESTQLNISSETSASNILEQLSIEIPNHETDGTQRVRTRASSKLESPLEVKQSPSDSPASCSVKNSNKAMKRKRQESENSIQSCASDDTPIRGMKIRKSSDVTASSSRSSSPMNVLNGNDYENVSNQKFDSSDSDEPLIEVAGKVRNAKMNKAAIDGDKAVLRNHLKLSNTQSPSGSTIQHSQLNSGGQLHKIDDKANTMSTRRSVRMNTTVAKVPKNATNQNNQDQINTTTNLITSNPSEGNMDQSRKSGNGTLSNVANNAESVDARRKTRSAGLEQTATEGRRRRLSRDNK